MYAFKRAWQVWGRISEHSKEDAQDLDAQDPFEAELVEHDAALSVFKSPRPSYTLDELRGREIRERLLDEATRSGFFDAD